jgi:hypothetical protein
MSERPRKKLLDHPDWEIPAPSREAVVGFLVTLAICLGLFLGLALFARWVRG